MTTSVAVPKYVITDVQSKFITKWPRTRKCGFPSSTTISDIPEPMIAPLSIHPTDAGIKSDFRNEQPPKDPSPIQVSFDPDSNITEESGQREKQPEHIISTSRGITTVGADPKYRTSEIPCKSAENHRKLGNWNFHPQH
jgi:hypothetical protein